MAQGCDVEVLLLHKYAGGVDLEQVSTHHLILEVDAQAGEKQLEHLRNLKGLLNADGVITAEHFLLAQGSLLCQLILSLLVLSFVEDVQKFAGVEAILSSWLIPRRLECFILLPWVTPPFVLLALNLLVHLRHEVGNANN